MKKWQHGSQQDISCWAGFAVPVRQPPSGTRTSVNINHRFQTPVHLQDLIRHLSSLPAICKIVTYQKCKTLKNVPRESRERVYLPPSLGEDCKVPLGHSASAAAADRQPRIIFKEQKIKGWWLWWKAAQMIAEGRIHVTEVCSFYMGLFWIHLGHEDQPWYGRQRDFRSRFTTSLPRKPAVWPWASCYASLSLCFL